MKTNENTLQWKVHTPNLLNEVLKNKGTFILEKPLNILGRLLGVVGERAIELNDPKLNALMCRLTIYSVADPYSKDYNKRITTETIRKGETAHKTKLQPQHQNAAKYRNQFQDAAQVLDTCLNGSAMEYRCIRNRIQYQTEIDKQQAVLRLFDEAVYSHEVGGRDDFRMIALEIINRYFFEIDTEAPDQAPADVLDIWDGVKVRNGWQERKNKA